jgi:hypothetical protein
MASLYVAQLWGKENMLECEIRIRTRRIHRVRNGVIVFCYFFVLASFLATGLLECKHHAQRF